jgi:two-component system sensor histidine kinase ChiS
VVSAASGPEALALIQGGLEPVVVLLDLMMPHMSGAEVCARLRAVRPAARLPVIMLTAKNRAEDLAQAFSAGANDFIAKPFVKEELLARVRSHAELARINRAYERYVPAEFLKFLKRDRIIDVELGDNVSQTMNVMFTDIRKFTNLTERLSPNEGFDLLVDYFAAISPAIYDHGGFLNHYTGDGMMALFPGSADSALQAAVAVQHAAQRFNQTRLSRSRPIVETGIGLHRGPVTLGILGHEDRRTANVVSDAANLASRIENLTSFYGIRIAASRALVDSLAEPGRFAIRELDRVRVQGKGQPVAVCEVFDGDDSASFDAKRASLPSYLAGVSAFRAGRFDDAARLFAEITRLNPQDGPAARFLEQSRDFVRSGPPDDWDAGIKVTKVAR